MFVYFNSTGCNFRSKGLQKRTIVNWVRCFAALLSESTQSWIHRMSNSKQSVNMSKQSDYLDFDVTNNFFCIWIDFGQYNYNVMTEASNRALTNFTANQQVQDGQSPPPVWFIESLLLMHKTMAAEQHVNIQTMSYFLGREENRDYFCAYTNKTWANEKAWTRKRLHCIVLDRPSENFFHMTTEVAWFLLHVLSLDKKIIDWSKFEFRAIL